MNPLLQAALPWIHDLSTLAAVAFSTAGVWWVLRETRRWRQRIEAAETAKSTAEGSERDARAAEQAARLSATVAQENESAARAALEAARASAAEAVTKAIASLEAQKWGWLRNGNTLRVRIADARYDAVTGKLVFTVGLLTPSGIPADAAGLILYGVRVEGREILCGPIRALPLPAQPLPGRSINHSEAPFRFEIAIPGDFVDPGARTIAVAWSKGAYDLYVREEPKGTATLFADNFTAIVDPA